MLGRSGAGVSEAEGHAVMESDLVLTDSMSPWIAMLDGGEDLPRWPTMRRWSDERFMRQCRAQATVQCLDDLVDEV